MSRFSKVLVAALAWATLSTVLLAMVETTTSKVSEPASASSGKTPAMKPVAPEVPSHRIARNPRKGTASRPNGTPQSNTKTADESTKSDDEPKSVLKKEGASSAKDAPSTADETASATPAPAQDDAGEELLAQSHKSVLKKAVRKEAPADDSSEATDAKSEPTPAEPAEQESADSKPTEVAAKPKAEPEADESTASDEADSDDDATQSESSEEPAKSADKPSDEKGADAAKQTPTPAEAPQLAHRPANESEPPAPAPLPELPQPTPLTPELLALQERVQATINLYSTKHLNARDHSPWEVMHQIIAFGTDAQLFKAPGGPTVSAVGWMCYNYPCRGERIFYLDERSKLVVRKGPGLQGHYGQLLAILAQAHVTQDYPLLIMGKKFTVEDLIEHEKADCQAGEELTFKLIGLSHFLEIDATWKSRDGKTWSIPKLMAEEIKQPINGAACGGTHRLMGLSYAVAMRRNSGEPIDGEYERAEKYIRDYHRYTMSLQNPDGSFSTEWFKRKGTTQDVDRRLKTTGHMVEWLSFSLPQKELEHPRMQKAVNYLCSILQEHADRVWENGPRGHAIHALRVYQRRMFGPYDLPQSTPDPQLTKAAPESPAEPRIADRRKAEETSELPAPREPRRLTDWSDEPDEGSPDFEE